MSGLLERIARRRRAAARAEQAPPAWREPHEPSEKSRKPGWRAYLEPVDNGAGGKPEPPKAQDEGGDPEPAAPEPVTSKRDTAPRWFAEAAAWTEDETDPEMAADTKGRAPEREVELEAEQREEQEPVGPASSPSGWRARAELRRRARYLRRLQEAQLRDLGEFVLELQRFGRERPELVREKAQVAAQTDDELRAIESALDRKRSHVP